MHHFVTILSLTLSCLISKIVGQNTAIGFKETFGIGHKHIAEGVENFRELLLKSDLFVDKSLLLKELLNDTTNRISAINYPRNWGKSLNLNMLKTFLEIEVDKKGKRIVPHRETRNYRLFKKGEIIADNGETWKLRSPLLISEHDDIIDEFQGKVPVIFFNLTALNPCTGFDDLYAEIMNRISDSFAEHEYMKEVLNEMISNKSIPENERDLAARNLQMFEKILTKKGDTTDVQKSFNFLAEILHEYFKEKVFILVDSYDTPFNNSFLSRTFPRSHEQLFVGFYRRLVYYTFLSNPSMNKAILTGVIPITNGDLLLSLNGAREITVLHPTNVHNYYGFYADEVDELLTIHEINNKTASEFHQHYDAYAVGYPTRAKIVEALSVVHFLNTGKFIRTNIGFLVKYLLVDSIRLASHTLISGLQLPVDFRNLSLSKEDFMHLQNASYYNEMAYGPMVRSFLKYSLAVGYLTLTRFDFLDKICLRYANGEVFATTGEWLEVYYAEKFAFDLNAVRPLVKVFPEDFLEFAKSAELTSPQLKSTLEKFFSYVFRPYGYITNENEEAVYLVLNYLTIFLKTFKRYASYGTEILLFEKELGVVIKATFNDTSAEEAVHLAKRSRSRFKPLNFPKLKLIGVNVRPNSSVDVLARMWQPIPIDEIG